MNSFQDDSQSHFRTPKVKVSRAELEENRARLAEKMAKATGAIVAPAGALVLEDVAALPQKPKEIEPMNRNGVITIEPGELDEILSQPGYDAVVTAAPANGAGPATATPTPKGGKGRKEHYDPADIRAWHTEYVTENAPLSEIGARHGINQTRLSKEFKKLGLGLLPVGRNSGGKGRKRGESSAATAAAFARKAAADRLAKANDQLITRWHKLYLDGMTAKELGLREGVSPVALLNRFREMGLHVFEDDPIQPDTRQPYEPPAVTAVPLNGDGPHAAAAREMVAGVGAQTPADEIPFLTPSQAANIANVSYETVRRWCHAGKLPFEEAGAGDMAIRRSDLDKFLQERKVQKAALPIVGYGILHDMIGLLPVHGFWTAEERGLWLDAFTALVKLYTRETRP